jgi:TonB family protein
MARTMPGAGAIVERRWYPRKNVLKSQLLTAGIALRSVNGAMRRQSGVVIDLSAGGLGLQPFLSLTRGVVVEVHLPLPGAARVFQGSGMVVWVASSGRAGIRFLDVPQSAREQLRGWLSQDGHVASEPEKIVPEAAAPGSPENTDSDDLDFQAALELIAERAQVITGSHGAAIALGDNTGMVCRASVGQAPDPGVRLQPDTGLSGYCLRTGEVVHCNNTQNDPRVNAAAARRLSLGSVIVIPVYALGQLAGLLEVFSSRPGAFDSRQVNRLERFAELLGSAVEEHQRARKLAARATASSASTNLPESPANPTPAPATAAEIASVDRPVAESPATSIISAEPQAPPTIEREPQTQPGARAESQAPLLQAQARPAEDPAERAILVPAPPAPLSPHFVLEPVINSIPHPRTVAGQPALPSGGMQEAPSALAAGEIRLRETCPHCGHTNPLGTPQCENCHVLLHTTSKIEPAEQAFGVAPIAKAPRENRSGQSSSVTLHTRKIRAFALGAAILLLLCVLAFFVGRYIGHIRTETKPKASATSTDSPLEPQAALHASSRQAAAEAPATPSPAAESVMRTNVPAPEPAKLEVIPPPPAKTGRSADPVAPMRVAMWPEKELRAQRPPGDKTKTGSPAVATALTAVMMSQGSAEAVPVSQITAGKLIYQVDPVFPASARAKELSGAVVLAAIVTKSGSVKDVSVISGPELLGAAAADAVSQWRYQPYRAAGQPVDAQTTITVTFPPR